MKARTDTPAEYVVRRKPLKGISDEEILSYAADILLKRVLRQDGIALTSPETVKTYLRTAIGVLEHEVFVALWLDAKHRVLKIEELFRGTLSQTNVYPREVVKSALRVNAAAVIFAHNHPSGVSDPSRADELLTRSLKDSLFLVDVRVLDHLIVTVGEVVSFAERGLL